MYNSCSKLTFRYNSTVSRGDVSTYIRHGSRTAAVIAAEWSHEAGMAGKVALHHWRPSWLKQGRAGLGLIRRPGRGAEAPTAQESAGSSQRTARHSGRK